MKKLQLLLVLLLAGIAAYFLNEGRKLRGSESIASEELNLLREAVKKSPGAAPSSTLAGKSSRPPAIDTTKFTADLTDILKAGPGPENGKKLEELLIAYRPQLESASLPKLKEIIDFLEKNFPFDQAGTELAQFVWFGAVGGAAKHDPEWAFAKFGEAASTTKIPIDMQLTMLKGLPAQNGEAMSPAHATALQKWLDAAQAAGRIEATDPLVAGLRAEIAAAQGDQSAAVKQISELPSQSQRKAAVDYLKGLPTPEAQRKGMEELSVALDFDGFATAVQSLADQQGFDAARLILSSATLAPDKHDMAAASIASAKIGPETKDRAAWLLENLRSGDHRPLDQFASTWTEGNYTEAANWIATMQPGAKRDAALRGFIPAAARIDGATAMDWALTVSDPLLRNQLYCEAHEKWKKIDAEQANQYHDAHPLDMEALKAASK
jgi:hypothetical protein